MLFREYCVRRTPNGAFSRERGPPVNSADSVSKQVRDGEFVGPQSPAYARPSPRQDSPHFVRIHRQRRADLLGILSQAMQAADRLR